MTANRWAYMPPPEVDTSWADAMAVTYCPVCGTESIGRSWTTDTCGACAETYEETP